MAASTLPKPGTKYGPCNETCQHRDCYETRVMAVSPCRYCGKAIGYDRRFYTDPDQSHGPAKRWVHASCHEDAVEKERGDR